MPVCASSTGPMNARDQLHWNLSGWLGAQLGGSAWMLISGILSYRLHQTTAITVLALFAITNLIGFGLWRLRNRLSPHAGIQILLTALGIFGLATVFVLDRAGIYEAIQIGASVSAKATYAVLIVVIAAMMFMFYFRFGRRSQSTNEAT